MWSCACFWKNDWRDGGVDDDLAVRFGRDAAVSYQIETVCRSLRVVAWHAQQQHIVGAAELPCHCQQCFVVDAFVVDTQAPPVGSVLEDLPKQLVDAREGLAAAGVAADQPPPAEILNGPPQPAQAHDSAAPPACFAEQRPSPYCQGHATDHQFRRSFSPKLCHADAHQCSSYETPTGHHHGCRPSVPRVAGSRTKALPVGSTLRTPWPLPPSVRLFTTASPTNRSIARRRGRAP